MWVISVADQATADVYIARVEVRIVSLTEFPERGTPRDELAARFRSLAFERRLVIEYKIDGTVATVLRVINGARDPGQQF